MTASDIFFALLFIIMVHLFVEIRNHRRQHLFMYCPKCRNELIKNGIFLDNVRDLDRYKCNECGFISTWDMAYFPIPVLISCIDCVHLEFNSGGEGECCQDCSPETKVKFEYKKNGAECKS